MPILTGGYVGNQQAWNTAVFAAHAREDIPALIAEIRRLKGQPISESYHGDMPEMPEQLREMLHEIPPTASGFGEIPPIAKPRVARTALATASTRRNNDRPSTATQ